MATRSYKRNSFAFESLEDRRLMAVDLVVEHDPAPVGVPGEEVTRVVRVHNLGDRDARDVLIRSTLSNELVDAVWERHVDHAKFITDASGREPDFDITLSADPYPVAGWTGYNWMNWL